MNNTLLNIKNLTAGYKQRIVLEKINLKIKRDEFLAIIGPNGSGKTTLLKVILGLLTPFSGSVEFPEGKITMGYLPQFTLNDHTFPITVQEIVESGLNSQKTIFKKHGNKEHKKTDAMLEKLGLAKIAAHSIQELSGGQLQRALLGRALISSPNLLVLDEPNTFIDKNFEKNFFSLLKELNSSIAIVIVSHDIGMISSYVKSIACVNRTLHYHPSNEVPEKFIEDYQCPVEMITHGKVPHRVLKEHQ